MSRREEAQTLSSENNDRGTGVRVPFPGAAFTLAGKAGVGVRNAWLWKSAMFGVAGTGRRIAELTGAARNRAALANVGKGPLINGGGGMARGNATLAKVETVVACTLAAAYVGAVVTANWDQLKFRPTNSVPLRKCEACGAPMEATTPDSPETRCAQHDDGGPGQA